MAHFHADNTIVVSTDAEHGDYVVEDETDDAAVVQAAYDAVVGGVSGDDREGGPIDPPTQTAGTLILDPADRPFEFDAPLDIWQSRSRVTATGGPTIVPAAGYDGPLITSGLRDATATGEDGLITDLSIEGLWVNGEGRAIGIKLHDVQLSTVRDIHVRHTGGPGLWIAGGCIENLFSNLVLSDDCGSPSEPAFLIRPTRGYADDLAQNVVVNSTHFSGIMIHFPTNNALEISSGTAPSTKPTYRHRKLQFTGCMFHSHARATAPLVTIDDAYELGFVGTQMLLWAEEGTCVRLGTEDGDQPVGSTTFSHCRFVGKPDCDVVGITCQNLETGATSLQAVGNTFDGRKGRLQHAVDWGDQADKRVSWAGNGVDIEGEPYVGTPPQQADESPF